MHVSGSNPYASAAGTRALVTEYTQGLHFLRPQALFSFNFLSWWDLFVNVWLGDRPAPVGRLATSGPSIFEELDRIHDNMNQHLESNPLEAPSYLASF